MAVVRYGGQPQPAPTMPEAGGLAFAILGGVDGARARLATLQRTGDLSSATHLGEFVPAAAPAFVRDVYGAAMRQSSTDTPLFTVVPMARYATDGATVPRISTGATVAVQTEGSCRRQTRAAEDADALCAPVAGRAERVAQPARQAHEP
jgi:hypothetical protein